ncbi:hypothetical protein Q8A67_023496 [Cirrhinus molitorella]|uniref:Ubiquitin-like protein 3 n=1 Tax=Cirrhinus molitorella TaxID=172907 RepID=A0AA88TKY5_9TELE|nr:hypothetical protein Q8A67_023496 [Cirrhinus molitorella]
MTGNIPVDMINLRLILVSGKTKEFLFSPNDSAADIAKHVYDNWPMDWEEEQVSSPNILRLIYQGRFLHGNVTLGALKLPLGKTTVMHLVARETLPEPNSQGQRNREKTGESNCCVTINYGNHGNLKGTPRGLRRKTTSCPCFLNYTRQMSTVNVHKYVSDWKIQLFEPPIFP